ncbi:MAG: alpha/beta hydrolase [Ruminococcaceae bacterium]|nr:alpha/beta hydrolase [Oscillospiraceae bacterium]
MKRFCVPSTDGKTTLAAYCTETENPVALLQISHGMCEYFLRYEEFADYLSENGILVFGHDHLGHGYSAPDAESRGFTAKGGGAEYLVGDVHALAERMHREYPDLPMILLGHSMGSFIAREALARDSEIYSAAIIMGTAGPDMPTGAGLLLANLIGRVRGERYRSRLLRSIAFAGYNKRCGKGCDKNAWLTCDEAVVSRYNADPMCHFIFTARAYADLFRILGLVSRRDWAKRYPKALPTLLVSGAEDPVGSWGRGVEKLAARMTDAGVSKLTLKLYPKMRHEILNELSKETVWSDLFAWMQTFVK